MMSLFTFTQSVGPIVMLILLLLIVGTVVYFAYVYWKEKLLFHSEEKILSQYEKVLTKAHKQARAIISHASLKAGRLLEKATDINSDATRTIHQKLAEETLRTMTLYEKELSTMQNQTLNSLQETVQGVEKLASRQLHDYRVSIEQDMAMSREALTKQTEEELLKAKEEIEAYKRDQLAQIDGKVTKLAQQLAQQVLGKSLALQDHEAFIKHALEKAKEEGLLAI